jgi:hypothetical protein
MTEKKNSPIDRKVFTDVRTIRKDGVLVVPNFNPPTDPPGLKPVSITPINQNPKKKSK